MSLQSNETIIWYGFFRSDGVGVTGLTVLIDIWKDTNVTREVADNECTELGGGFYRFEQTSPTAGFRVAKMKTEDTTVDSKEVGCIQLVGKGGIDYLDASVAGVEDKVDIVDSVVDSIEGKVDDLDTDLAVVDGVVDNIEDKVDIVDGIIDILDTNLDTANININAIDGKVDTIDSNIDTANTNISAILTKITTIHKIETGRWRITNNQFIIYDEDGTTPLLTFNLKDQLGNLTMENPFERTPI